MPLFSFLFLLFFSEIQIVKANDFLTEFEYAQMLYNEPRGVSCSKCHGARGNRKVSIPYTAYYVKRDRLTSKNKKIKIKEIFRLSFSEFENSMLRKKYMFMPKYKLSKLEIKSIYYFLQKVNGRVKRKKKVENIE